MIYFSVIQAHLQTGICNITFKCLSLYKLERVAIVNCSILVFLQRLCNFISPKNFLSQPCKLGMPKNLHLQSD